MALIAIDSFVWTTGGNETLIHRGIIDNGGSASVHKMEDIATGQIFARKVLHLFRVDASAVLQNELRAIAKLCHAGHANIIQVISVDNIPGMPYGFIDMELCDLNLAKFIECQWTRINASHRIPTGSLELETWNIMKQIAAGLEFIHEQKEVHRDLKPRNVLYSGRDNLWKLSDFGLTSEGTQGAHTTTSARGTSGYRPPELLKEKPFYGSKVDIWALGVILHELVTGKPPFESDAAVSDHYRSKQRLKIRINEGFDGHSRAAVYSSVLDMLQYIPDSRPTASTLFQKFCQYYDLSSAIERAAKDARIAAGKEYLGRPAADQVAPDSPVQKPLSSDHGQANGSPPMSSFGFDDPELLRRQYDLATEYHNSGRYQEAATLYKDTVMRMKNTFGPNHSETLASQVGLAFAFGTLRQHEEAIEMHKEVLSRKRKTLGLDHRDTLASQDDLARIYCQLGQYEDAAELYEDTLERRTIALGPENMETLSTQRDLDMVYVKLGRRDGVASPEEGTSEEEPVADSPPASI